MPPPLHKASLVEISSHSKEVLQLLDLEISPALIGYLAQETAEVVEHALSQPATSCDRSTGRSSEKRSEFAEFLAKLLYVAEVKIATLLVTLVYIRRCKPHLTIETEGWAFHRVFLGALILASKYTNDSTLKNRHWAIATGLFGKRDIGRIEREFLDVLNWELAVSESNILDLHDSIMALYPCRRLNRISRRFIPSVKTIFSRPDSDSEGSSPTSSPAPSTPSTSSSPPRRPGLKETKSIKNIAAHISHALSVPWASNSEQRFVSPSCSYSVAV